MLVLPVCGIIVMVNPFVSAVIPSIVAVYALPPPAVVTAGGISGICANGIFPSSPKDGTPISDAVKVMFPDRAFPFIVRVSGTAPIAARTSVGAAQNGAPLVFWRRNEPDVVGIESCVIVVLPEG